MAELNPSNFAPQVPGPGLPTGLQQAPQQGSAPSQQGDGLVGLLSLVSLLEGNPGPFFQLQEQKRKTQVFQALTPVLTKTSQLSNVGKWDEALQLAEQSFAQFGSRSPEIGQFLTQLTNRIQQRQYESTQLNAMADYLAAVMPEDHPSAKGVKQLQKLAKQGTPLAIQLGQQIVRGLLPEVQQFEGKTTLTSPLTAEQSVIAQPAIERISDIPPLVQQQIVNDPTVKQLFGGSPTPAGIVNALNSPEVPEEAKQQIRNAMASAQKMAFDFELAGKIPLDPVVGAGLLAAGKSKEDVAARRASASEWGKAVDFWAEKQRAIAGAVLTARKDVNTIYWPDARYTIDVNTGQVDTRTSAGQAAADPSKAMLDRDSMARVIPLYEARNKFSLLLPILNSLPDTFDLGQRVDSFVSREINQRLGLDPKLTGEQAVQTLVKTAIEDLANAQGVSAARFDYLTRPVSGTLASKQGAIEVLRKMSDFLETQSKTLIYQNNASQEKKFFKVPGEVTPTPGSVTEGKEEPRLFKGLRFRE